MHILVVEDNQIARIAYQIFLTQAGFEVTLSEEGLSAMEFIKQHHYDAVIMDVNLPALSGIEVTKKIRRMKDIKQPVIIGITADVDGDRPQECLKAGMNDVMSKPAPAEQIIATLKKYVLD